MTTTFDRIRAMIIRDFELPPERLRRDTLLEEIELDSLAITELVFEIEDEFKITAESTIPPFKTLGDIADYVARLVAERDAKAALKPAAAKPAIAKKPRAAKSAAPRGATNGASDGKRARSRAARTHEGSGAKPAAKVERAVRGTGAATGAQPGKRRRSSVRSGAHER